jgi:glycosyltransferase involved in cell wall biosynthesis
LVIEKKINCSLFVYNNYKDIDFKNALQDTKFVIWVGRHETQGFALQETLASNVPVLLWDVKSMYEEYENAWCYAPYKSTGFPLYATAAPVWSDECGIKIYDASELESAYNEMNARLDSFTPRKYIEEKNSLNVAFENLKKCLDI